jgi:hypothetical protein
MCYNKGMKMKKLIIALVVVLCGCTSPDKSYQALEAAGYKNIQMTGYSFFGCDEKDTFHDGFTAVGANGNPVEGTVCSGWFKGYTIRLD